MVAIIEVGNVEKHIYYYPKDTSEEELQQEIADLRPFYDDIIIIREAEEKK